MSFNSRAPRGARLHEENEFIRQIEFQFTCPSRSTTDPQVNVKTVKPVSIHVPLAEHDVGLTASRGWPGGFNSRAPRGARQLFIGRVARDCQFQFTCPSRSTTKSLCSASGLTEVSIHVPLAEHDAVQAFNTGCTESFNSRAPRGARRATTAYFRVRRRFNSRAPRGARRK